MPAFLFDDILLSLILFSPLLGVVLVMAIPGEHKGAIRWTAFVSSFIPFGLAMYLWFAYDPSVAGYQFVEQFEWYAAIGSSYHLGVDGISVPMVLLTTVLAPLGILASFGIDDRPKAFMVLFLLLEVGSLGVFLALDLLLFFVFYEVGLVPMYFLINQWGSKNRNYASFKFFVYTMGASLGMLLAIQLIGVSAGTFDMVELVNLWPTFQGEAFAGFLPMSAIKTIAFWAFTIAFALKVPVFPLHTWLPDAHTEAPTAGSMILAGVLLKLGAYGFLRLVLPLFPEQAYAAAGVLAVLAMLSIVLGAFAAFGQTDFKRLVAYSSINHMGFVMMGIAVMAFIQGAQLQGALSGDAQTTGAIAGTGAVLQMFNHGLSAAGMFFLVGVLYDRIHTRDLNEIGGGIWQHAPIYGGIMIFMSMASLGLPGLNGFVGEFAIVRGSWPVFTALTAISMLGLLFTGAYVLKGILMVLHGRESKRWAHYGLEINAREVFVVAPLMVMILLIGLYPFLLADPINQTILRMISG